MKNRLLYIVIALVAAITLPACSTRVYDYDGRPGYYQDGRRPRHHKPPKKPKKPKKHKAPKPPKPPKRDKHRNNHRGDDRRGNDHHRQHR